MDYLYLKRYKIVTLLRLQCNLKIRHILRWNVPYMTPLDIDFHHYLRMWFQGASSLSFNQTTKLTLANLTDATALRHSIELVGLKPS